MGECSLKSKVTTPPPITIPESTLAPKVIVRMSVSSTTVISDIIKLNTSSDQTTSPLAIPIPVNNRFPTNTKILPCS